jgi:glycosyltransferase involved in cell wall biosynthesis
MTSAGADRDRLRCLVVTPWYPSASRPVDGIFIREVARAVARRHDVAVLVADPAAPGTPPTRSDRIENGLRTLRMSFRPLPTARTSLPMRLLALRIGLERLLGTGFRPDVLHAHVYLGGAGALLLRRSLRVPVVVSEHLSSFVDESLGRPQRALARQVFERADLVCPVSDDLAGRLAALAPRARLRVVSNLVDTTLFHPPPARRGGPPRLAVVAGLHPRKGVHHLLNALVLVRERTPAVLEVAGDGPARADLEALADRLGIGAEVKFLGVQDRAGIAALMQRADLLALPSLVENQPVVLLEAQASGLPVVASNVGGVREVVDALAGRLVPSGDVNALAGAIWAVLAAPGHYDRSLIAKRARERYGAEAVAARWDAIYRELIATQRASRPDAWR